MDDLLTLKKKICEAIDENRDAFIALGHSVLREPETAFSEFKTAEKVRAALSGLGLQCQSGQAITGITADLHGRSDAAMIALMGELDAIILPDYPFADKTTGAAHVRGWDTGYIKECNEIVNRCLRASALAAPRWKSAIFPARSPSTSSPISSASCWTMKWRSSAAITSTRESACPPTQTTSPAHCPRADRRL